MSEPGFKSKVNCSVSVSKATVKKELVSENPTQTNCSFQTQNPSLPTRLGICLAFPCEKSFGGEQRGVGGGAV